MEHGAPVFVAAAADLDPGLVDGETVIVVPKRRDAPAIARGVRRVLGDEALGRRVAEGGRRLAATRSWPTVAGQHALLYAELVARAAR